MDIAIDLSRLTPAPWGASKDGDMVCHPSSEETIRKIKAKEFPFTGRRICFNEVSAYMDAATIKVNMEFIALARNAFDVMVRRGWVVGFSRQKGPLHGWYVTLPPEMFPLDSKVYPLLNLRAADPFTVLDEADKWYKKNVEGE